MTAVVNTTIGNITITSVMLILSHLLIFTDFGSLMTNTRHKMKKSFIFSVTNSLHFNLLHLMLFRVYSYKHFHVFV